MNNKIYWVAKLTSRKLWVAIATMVSGFILAFGGSESEAQIVSGCIMSTAAVVAYIIGEGLVDANRAATKVETVEASLAIDADQTHIADHEDSGVM